MLLIHHKGLNKWLLTGGHIEDNSSTWAAIREDLGNWRNKPSDKDINNLALKDKERKFHDRTPLMYQIIPKAEKMLVYPYDMVFSSWGWWFRQDYRTV